MRKTLSPAAPQDAGVKHSEIVRVLKRGASEYGLLISLIVIMAFFQMSTSSVSFGPSPRLMSIASNVQSHSTPAETCAPWKPVSVKNDEPNRLVLIVRPSCTNEVNSYA